MKARQIIEAETAKQFIKRMPKPLRLGKGWTLYISGSPRNDPRAYDNIPVELIHQETGYFPNTLDAPYNLAADVDASFLHQGGQYDEDRHTLLIDGYWNQIYKSVAKGILRGKISGAAGPRDWELMNDHPNEHPD